MVHACTCTTCCKIGSRIPSPSHFLPHFHLSLNNLQSTQSTYLAIPAGVLHLSLNLASGRVCLWLMVRHFLYALPARLHVVVLDVPRCERDGKDSMFPDFPPKTPQIISIQPSRPPRCGDFPCITHPARYLLSSPPHPPPRLPHSVPSPLLLRHAHDTDLKPIRRNGRRLNGMATRPCSPSATTRRAARTRVARREACWLSLAMTAQRRSGG